MNVKQRIIVSALTLSVGGFAAWKSNEGYSDVAIIPVKGDVPTIGHGNTFYEDGTRVKLGDRITPARADQLARNVLAKKERAFAATIPGVKLHPEEFDLYLDFVGQYGIGTWGKSSMRKHLLAGNYYASCKSLLQYKFVNGYDCSTPGNKRCYGVWTRQLDRVAKCLSVQ